MAAAVAGLRLAFGRAAARAPDGIDGLERELWRQLERDLAAGIPLRFGVNEHVSGDRVNVTLRATVPNGLDVDSKLLAVAFGRVSALSRNVGHDANELETVRRLDAIGEQRARIFEVLCPKPRINLVLYSGVLAPNAKLRSKVADDRPGPLPEPPLTETQTRAERESWAELMRSTFGLDVLVCPRCGDRLRYIATITDVRVARRILEHLNLPARAPHGLDRRRALWVGLEAFATRAAQRSLPPSVTRSSRTSRRSKRAPALLLAAREQRRVRVTSQGGREARLSNLMEAKATVAIERGVSRAESRPRDGDHFEARHGDDSDSWRGVLLDLTCSKSVCRADLEIPFDLSLQGPLKEQLALTTNVRIEADVCDGKLPLVEARVVGWEEPPPIPYLTDAGT